MKQDMRKLRSCLLRTWLLHVRVLTVLALTATATASGQTQQADNSSKIVGGKYRNVTLLGSSNTSDGTWNTVCLPFDVTIAGSPYKDFIVKELDANASCLNDKGELRLEFVEVTEKMEAGKPYILKKKGESGDGQPLNAPASNGVTRASGGPIPIMFRNALGADCAFVGQYSPFLISDDDAALGFYTDHGNIDEILFFASDPVSKKTVLGYSQSPRTLKAMRAHFYVPAKANGARSVVRSVNINFGDGTDATGVVELKNSRIEELNSDDGWYSMDGRKLSGEPKAKGLYIHNGKKMIIK